jgi:class 3 adenylate cyclase
LREKLKESNGYEVKVQGDSFLVVFANPLGALKWSLAVQEALLEYE